MVGATGPTGPTVLPVAFSATYIGLGIGIDVGEEIDISLPFVQFNTGAYDGINTFTAPVTGYYHFTFMTSVNSGSILTATVDCRIRFLVNNNVVTGAYGIRYIQNIVSSVTSNYIGYFPVTLSQILSLNAGDVVRVNVLNSSNIEIMLAEGPLTIFSGCLVSM